jgi:hypothetical protein
MPRGRPRTIPKIQPDDLELEIADVISRYCGIPGCGPRNHVDEARNILEVIWKRVPRETIKVNE